MTRKRTYNTESTGKIHNLSFEQDVPAKYVFDLHRVATQYTKLESDIAAYMLEKNIKIEKKELNSQKEAIKCIKKSREATAKTSFTRRLSRALMSPET